MILEFNKIVQWFSGIAAKLLQIGDDTVESMALMNCSYAILTVMDILLSDDVIGVGFPSGSEELGVAVLVLSNEEAFLSVASGTEPLKAGWVGVLAAVCLCPIGRLLKR